MTTSLPTTEVEGRYLRTRPDRTVQLPCTRCGDGDGYIAAYSHVHGGVCFHCSGGGGPWVTVDEAAAIYRRRDADRRRRADRQAKKAAKVRAAVEAFLATHPELAPLELEDQHHILMDLRSHLHRTGQLSQKQVDLAVRILTDREERAARRAAEQAAAQPAPTGRLEVAGEVISVKDCEDTYSPYGGTIWKMTVRADAGFRVHCTIPNGLLPGVVTTAYAAEVRALRGQRIGFTATLTPSDDDATFAFGKRPTKARILAPEHAPEA